MINVAGAKSSLARLLAHIFFVATVLVMAGWSLNVEMIRHLAPGFVITNLLLFGLVFRRLQKEIDERKKAADQIDVLNRRLQEQLYVSQIANRELEAFSYSVSHDLRAPLRAIDGFSRILMEDYAPHFDEEGKRLLGVIRSNTQRMAALIDDLLAFSRISRQQLTFSHVDMAGLADAAVEDSKKADPSRRLFVRVGRLPAASGDMAMVRQVWINLVSNAFKFTRRTPEAWIEVGGSAQADHNLYWVKDNGAGFDMTYGDKLFGIFQRLHAMDEYEGTGVGLALVQRIVLKHGGKIWAEAKPNEGAAFYFTLPTTKGGENGAAAGRDPAGRR